MPATRLRNIAIFQHYAGEISYLLFSNGPVNFYQTLMPFNKIVVLYGFYKLLFSKTGYDTEKRMASIECVLQIFALFSRMTLIKMEKKNLLESIKIV